MILNFKTSFNNNPTFFVAKIYASVWESYRDEFKPKIHTMRAGNRWKAGKEMHLSTGARSKNYFQFNKDIAELRYCKSVQEVEVIYGELGTIEIIIDGKLFYTNELCAENFSMNYWLEEFAQNDGFDSVEDFFAWFKESFKGQLIHFTDFKYA